MSRPTVTMRFDSPEDLNTRLHVLASQLRVPVRDLLLDGVHLVLRYNNAGHGIPAPPIRVPPVVPDVQETEVEVEEEVLP